MILKQGQQGLPEPLASTPWQLYNTIMVTGVVGFLGIKNLIWGVSPLAGSVGLFNIASAVTIISGYPLLRRGLHTLTSGGPVNTDLVMGSVGLVTSVLRESMLGLLVTCGECYLAGKRGGS